MRIPHVRPAAAALVAGAAVVLAVAAGLLLVGRDTTEPGPPMGAVLDGTDRSSLDAVPVRRGRTPPAADPAVDLTDPAAVARAYLTAARTTDAGDRGATHLRAARYAAPGSPPAAVGVVVLDPPPPGQLRTAAVTALDLVAADATDTRRGYRVTVTTATGPPGRAGSTTASTAYVALARQPDGRWLVTVDTSDVPEGGD